MSGDNQFSYSGVWWATTLDRAQQKQFLSVPLSLGPQTPMSDANHPPPMSRMIPWLFPPVSRGLRIGWCPAASVTLHMVSLKGQWLWGPRTCTQSQGKSRQTHITSYDPASEMAKHHLRCIALSQSKKKLYLFTGNGKVLTENVALEYCHGHFCRHNLPLCTICPKNLHPSNKQNILPTPHSRCSIHDLITISDLGLRSQILWSGSGSGENKPWWQFFKYSSSLVAV